MRISHMQAELFITLLQFGLIKTSTFKIQKQFCNFYNKNPSKRTYSFLFANTCFLKNQKVIDKCEHKNDITPFFQVSFR